MSQKPFPHSGLRAVSAPDQHRDSRRPAPLRQGHQFRLRRIPRTGAPGAGKYSLDAPKPALTLESDVVRGVESELEVRRGCAARECRSLTRIEIIGPLSRDSFRCANCPVRLQRTQIIKASASTTGIRNKRCSISKVHGRLSRDRFQHSAIDSFRCWIGLKYRKRLKM